MIAIWERFIGDISPRIYKIVLVLTFFSACYIAWLQQRNIASAAECNIYVFQKRSEAKKQLAEFHMQADKFIFSSSLTKDSLQSEFDMWLAETNKWYAEVAKWVLENLGPQAIAKLKDVSNPPIVN